MVIQLNAIFLPHHSANYVTPENRSTVIKNLVRIQIPLSIRSGYDVSSVEMLIRNALKVALPSIYNR